MTEKEKLENGLEYNIENSKELMEELTNAKDKCFEYNQTKPSNMEKRKEILRNLLGKVKGEFWIEQPFYCDYGYNIEIGEKFYSNHNLVILDGARVKIGDNVLIGPNCGIYTARHSLDAKRRNEGFESGKPITIGDNVWLGGNVIILPGVTIGNNAVIGAGSVVTRNIPDNVLAVGNPCRVVREI